MRSHISFCLFHIQGLSSACQSVWQPSLLFSLSVCTHQQNSQSPDVASWGAWCFSRAQFKHSNPKLTGKSINPIIPSYPSSLNSLSLSSLLSLFLYPLNIWSRCGHELANLVSKPGLLCLFETFLHFYLRYSHQASQGSFSLLPFSFLSVSHSLPLSISLSTVTLSRCGNTGLCCGSAKFRSNSYHMGDWENSSLLA